MTAITESTLQACIEDYFDGIFHGDVAQLRRAFHPHARLTGIVGGEPYERDLDTYLNAVAERVSPEAGGETRQMRIETTAVEGRIGHVHARLAFMGKEYIDFLSLIHDGQRWSIIHKNFTDVQPQRER